MFGRGIIPRKTTHGLLAKRQKGGTTRTLETTERRKKGRHPKFESYLPLGRSWLRPRFQNAPNDKGPRGACSSRLTDAEGQTQPAAFGAHLHLFASSTLTSPRCHSSSAASHSLLHRPANRGASWCEPAYICTGPKESRRLHSRLAFGIPFAIGPHEEATRPASRTSSGVRRVGQTSGALSIFSRGLRRHETEADGDATRRDVGPSTLAAWSYASWDAPMHGSRHVSGCPRRLITNAAS